MNVHVSAACFTVFFVKPRPDHVTGAGPLLPPSSTTIRNGWLFIRRWYVTKKFLMVYIYHGYSRLHLGGLQLPRLQPSQSWLPGLQRLWCIAMVTGVYFCHWGCCKSCEFISRVTLITSVNGDVGLVTVVTQWSDSRSVKRSLVRRGWQKIAPAACRCLQRTTPSSSDCFSRQELQLLEQEQVLFLLGKKHNILKVNCSFIFSRRRLPSVSGHK